MTLLAGAIPSNAHAAIVYFNLQDQDASDPNDDQNPASDYDLPANYPGSPDITVTGTLSSELTVDFVGMYVSAVGDLYPGYGNPNGTTLYGNNSTDTITFNQPVTDVDFRISAYGASSGQYSPTTGVSIVGSLDNQPAFTYSFPPGIDGNTAGDWYLVDGGATAVNTITFYDFSALPLGDLQVTTVPEPVPAALLLVASSFLLSHRPVRRIPSPSA
jgi:hypothetical protein